MSKIYGLPCLIVFGLSLIFRCLLPLRDFQKPQKPHTHQRQLADVLKDVQKCPTSKKIRKPLTSILEPQKWNETRAPSLRSAGFPGNWSLPLVAHTRTFVMIKTVFGSTLLYG